MRRLWPLLLVVGCATPPLALNTAALLPPRPAAVTPLSDNFSVLDIPMAPLSQSPWQMRRLLTFGGEVFALVSEGNLIKLVRYDGGWKVAHEGLSLPADGFHDPATVDSLRTDSDPQVDLLEDILPVNNRLVLIYRKTMLSASGDRPHSFAFLWDPRTAKWQEFLDTEGLLAPINPEGASEAPNAVAGDLFLRLHTDPEHVSLFKYNIFKATRENIGTFACPSDSVQRVYLGDEMACFVYKMDYEVVRYHLKPGEEPQAWKVGDHTTLIQEDVPTRILAISGSLVYFLYDQNNHANLGCFSLDTNQVDPLDAINQKILLPSDQPANLLAAYSDSKLYLASPKGLFYLHAKDPNHILFPFGRFPDLGDGFRLLLCGIDQASGSMGVAPMRPDQSLTLFVSNGP